MLRLSVILCFPLALGALLAGCASTPQRNAATPAVGSMSTVACGDLQRSFTFAGTRIASVEEVAAGALRLPGIAEPMPAHCVVKGAMNERIGTVDGKPYAIGFEMRLPRQWNGRFFYQANGGLDGIVTPAYGDTLGGGPRSNGLLKGFAVISSDAGHAMERNVPGIGAALFGRDPQARLDYGFNAVAQLTPMAQALIRSFYGRPADKSYLIGSSNGGRHGMVAAARDTGRYDGILAMAPGMNLPTAALTQVWDAQQFASVSQPDPKTGRPDLNTAFTPAQFAAVSDAVLAQCDALDGLADGIIADPIACQKRFDPARHLPVCAGKPAPDCITPAQQSVLVRLASGPSVYPGLPWDSGLRGADWRAWKLVYSVGSRDAVALAYVFQTPPASPDVVSGQGSTLQDFALGFDLSRNAGTVNAKDAVYTQSAMEFMTPPDPTGLQAFIDRGGKLLVSHGVSDPVFSALDTVRWYDAFVARHGASAADSVRLFLVPGMNHTRNGPATDQFDMVDALVRWVEQGQAPDAIVATARGPGSNVVNPEVPASWRPDRSRLLCPYPSVARYVGGTGNFDSESAASFACAR